MSNFQSNPWDYETKLPKSTHVPKLTYYKEPFTPLAKPLKDNRKKLQRAQSTKSLTPCFLKRERRHPEEPPRCQTSMTFPKRRRFPSSVAVGSPVRKYNTVWKRSAPSKPLKTSRTPTLKMEEIKRLQDKLKELRAERERIEGTVNCHQMFPYSAAKRVRDTELIPTSSSIESTDNFSVGTYSDLTISPSNSDTDPGVRHQVQFKKRENAKVLDTIEDVYYNSKRRLPPKRPKKKAPLKLGPPSFLTKYLARDAARNRGINGTKKLSMKNNKTKKKKKNRKKRPGSAPSFYNKPRSKKKVAVEDTEFVALRFEAKQIPWMTKAPLWKAITSRQFWTAKEKARHNFIRSVQSTLEKEKKKKKLVRRKTKPILPANRSSSPTKKKSSMRSKPDCSSGQKSLPTKHHSATEDGKPQKRKPSSVTPLDLAKQIVKMYQKTKDNKNKRKVKVEWFESKLKMVTALVRDGTNPNEKNEVGEAIRSILSEVPGGEEAIVRGENQFHHMQTKKQAKEAYSDGTRSKRLADQRFSTAENAEYEQLYQQARVSGRKYLKKALKSFQESVLLCPKNQVYLLAQADIEHDLGNLEDCYKTCLRIVELGEGVNRAGRLGIRQVFAASDNNQRISRAYERMGEIEKIRGNLPESRKLLQRAIDIQKEAKSEAEKVPNAKEKALNLHLARYALARKKKQEDDLLRTDGEQRKWDPHWEKLGIEEGTKEPQNFVFQKAIKSKMEPFINENNQKKLNRVAINEESKRLGQLRLRELSLSWKRQKKEILDRIKSRPLLMEDCGSGSKLRLAAERIRRLKMIKEGLVRAKMKPEAIKDCFDPEEYQILISHEQNRGFEGG